VSRTICLAAASTICLHVALVSAGDWNQWRGANRDGVAADSPTLIEALPDDGIQPEWISAPIKSARDGGWGSPIVADGRVILFAHSREQLRELGPVKFPWLPPEKRGGMTDAEYAEYERNRRDEDEDRATAFAFREHVYCFDADTGESLWTHDADSVYTRFPQSGSPCAAGDRVYLLGAGRYVRSFDVRTGEEAWSTFLPGEFRDEFMQSSLVVVDGIVVVMADHLFGLDGGNGSIVWEGDPEQSRGSHSSPVVWKSGDRSLVIVNVAGGKTGCFAQTNGHELWSVESEAAQATPVVIGDRLITYGNSRAKGLRCFALSESGAEELWRYRGLQDKGSSPVVVDGHVYVQGESRIACINLETGEAEWSDYLDLRNPQYSSPIAADGKVFYAYEALVCFRAEPDGFNTLFDAHFDNNGLMASERTFRRLLDLDQGAREENERVLLRHLGPNAPLPCASPAFANGRIYIRLKNALACYDLRAKAE